jgi:hypothetical protein
VPDAPRPIALEAVMRSLLAIFVKALIDIRDWLKNLPYRL